MFKFTLSYPNGLKISYNAETYQQFLQVLVDSDVIGKNELAWLVGYKDLRVDTTYAHWKQGSTVRMRKEKVDA